MGTHVITFVMTVDNAHLSDENFKFKAKTQRILY